MLLEGCAEACGTAYPSRPPQASEYQSHKWTVYLRSPTGEDLSHVIKKVRGLQKKFRDSP